MNKMGEKNVRVCHLSSAHKYNDIRIFHKECSFLAKEGYDVYYVVPETDDMVINGVKICGVKSGGSSRMKRMLLTTAAVFRRALKTNASVYHFHDPELMPYGILLRCIGRKVIYDVHEYLAADILDKPWIKGTLLRKVVSIKMNLIEKFCSFFYNKIVTVTPEIAAQFSSGKSMVIRNFPIVKWIDSVPPKVMETNKKIIVYSGMLTRNRGISEMIEAMNYIDDAMLLLMGNWESAEYENYCRNLDGYKKTKYTGLLKQDEVYAITKSATIGIINFYPIANHVQSLPNKAFEYMSCRLPMVLSDINYWKSHFSQCALFANPYSPESIAFAINKLLNEDTLCHQFAAAGRQLIDNEYSWESEYRKLSEVYQSLTT